MEKAQTHNDFLTKIGGLDTIMELTKVFHKNIVED